MRTRQKAKPTEEWIPIQDGDGLMRRGLEEYRIELEGFCSKIYKTLLEADQKGRQEYEAWRARRQAKGNKGGARTQHNAAAAAQGAPQPPAAPPAPAAAAAGQPASKKRKRQQRVSPDASTDGMLQMAVEQPDAAAAAAAAAAGEPAMQQQQQRRKRAKQAASPAAGAADDNGPSPEPAQQSPARRKRRGAAAAGGGGADGGGDNAGLGGGGSQLGDEEDAGRGPRAEQTPSAATDADNTMPLHPSPNKQRRGKAAAAAGGGGGGAGKGTKRGVGAKRGRKGAAAAAASPPSELLPSPPYQWPSAGGAAAAAGGGGAWQQQQPRQPNARAAGQGTKPQTRRTRAAAAADSDDDGGDDDGLNNGGGGAAGQRRKQQRRPNAPAAAAATGGPGGDDDAAAAAGGGGVTAAAGRTRRARKAAEEAAAAAAAAAGAYEDEDEELLLDSHQRQQKRRARQQQQQQEMGYGADGGDDGLRSLSQPMSVDVGANLTQSWDQEDELVPEEGEVWEEDDLFRPEQPQPAEPPMRTSESAGSNWLPPDLAAAGGEGRRGGAGGAGGAAAAAGGLGMGGGGGAAGAAAAAAGGGLDGKLYVQYQGGKASKSGSVALDTQLGQQLGKGGFGAVYKVMVKATGQDSLGGLKLSGPLLNSIKAVIKKGKAQHLKEAAAAARRYKQGSGNRKTAAGAGGTGNKAAAARSRVGAGGTSDGGTGTAGGGGGAGGDEGGGSAYTFYVPMALKVALGFDQLSYEMQDNFKTPSAFDANVQQRMREEYDIMHACAGSPHIIDAYCMGRVYLAGAWRPCILMELSGLGDAERVFIQPPSWALHRGPSGVSAVAAQRIVRQAALALKDLHSMAGSMHLDVKVNNLLVFGSKESPQIKMIDFGCAKRRSDAPRYGPASGTKDWQAPEQMAAGEHAHSAHGPPAGRLDYCTDSWALGLLVLMLRKGQQPFWWLKQEGRLPSEMPDVLRESLSSPSSPYLQDTPRGSKLTRLELAFVSSCMASSSNSRPPVTELLDSDPYLSSRYRGG